MNSESTHHILLYNRISGRIEEEKVFEREGMIFFYGTFIGRLLTKIFWSRLFFSRIYGWLLRHPISRKRIETFQTQFGVEEDEAIVPTNGFRSFNDFFIRKLKPVCRPVVHNADQLIAPADSRLRVFSVDKGTCLQIKGTTLKLEQLLGAQGPVAVFGRGLCLQFRLAPSDCHRFGYIDHGVQGPIHTVKGALYSVSPLAMRNRPTIWVDNYRQWCFLETIHFGTVIQVEVGATAVGSIVQHQPSGGRCWRGQEKGYFQMGGSTILILFQPGCVALDKDILEYSKQGIECLVKFGESVGHTPRHLPKVTA